MTRKIKILYSFLVLTLAIFFLSFDLANAAGIVPCGTNSTPCTLCHLVIGIKALIDWGTKVLAVAAIVAIVIAGVMYIISSGHTGMMESAKKFLMASLTGFAIVVGAWIIVNTVFWLLSANPVKSGISASNWYSFSCSTASSALTAPTSSTPGSMAQNAQQTQQNQADCSKYCSDYGYIGDELASCNNDCMATKTAQQATATSSQNTAKNNEDCTKYCDAGGDGISDNATCKANCMAAKNTQSGSGNGNVVNAAQQAKAAGCQYNQQLRNDCTGNPGYTDCGQLACDSFKSAGNTSMGNCSSINTGKLYSHADAVGDKSSLKAGDVLVRYNGPGDGHAVICENDGCSTITHAAGKDKGIVTGQKNYMLDSKYNTKVIRS